MRAKDDLPESGNQLLRCDFLISVTADGVREAQVIDAFENGQIPDAVLRKNITVKTRESIHTIELCIVEDTIASRYPR